MSFLSLAMGILISPCSDPDRGAVAYEFRQSKEMRDFEVLQGDWRVQGGGLVCISKNLRDEVRWRRSLPSAFRLEGELTAGTTLGLELTRTGVPTQILFDRRRQSVQVLENGRDLCQHHFEWPTHQSLVLHLKHDGSSLEIGIGGEDRWHVPCKPARGLRLISQRNQSRWDRLKIVPLAEQSEEFAANETQQLRLEDALSFLRRGEIPMARETFRALVPETPPDPRRELPSSLLLALNEWAWTDAEARRWDPVASLLHATRVESEDGTVSLHLPFRSSWSAEVLRTRRVDGDMLVVRCGSPPVEVRASRYDGRIRYWFGEEPRLLFIPGGNPTILARSRYQDLVLEKPGAEGRVSPRESKLALGGRDTTWFELTYVDPTSNAPQAPNVVREYFLQSRGNTHRWSVEGATTAIALVEDELAWMLNSIQLHNGMPAVPSER